MILPYILTSTLLSTFCLSNLISIQPVLASSCPEENTQDSRPTRYRWRGNRCEGLIGYPASGAPEVISVSINGLRGGRQGYGKTSVEVKSFSRLAPMRFSIHAFLNNEKYVMDKFSANQPFIWNTSDVMQKVGVKPEDLSAIAVDFRTNQETYLPVLIGGKATSYEFVFRANADVQFLTLTIKDKSGKLIRKLDVGTTQPKRRLIIRHWDGKDFSRQRVSKGLYQLVYEGYSEKRDGATVPFGDSIRFEHNPDWLTP